MTKNKPNAAIQHQDQLNQEILVGSTVVFSRAYSNSLQIGTVVKITRRRVRIAYCYKWISNQTNEQRISEWQYLAPPERVLVLTDSLGVELMMLKLRGLLP
jgi:hypothetical protein